MLFNTNYKFLTVVAFFGACIALTSCSNNSAIVGYWKVLEVKNPNLNKQIEAALMDIDTTGNNDEVIGQYINKDSLKRARKAALQTDIDEQQALVKSLHFDFKANERVYISTLAGTDSALWRIEDKTNLVIDGPALTGIGDAELYEILLLSKDTLRLKNVAGADSVIFTLVPAKN
jgi:hypothetical protein